MSRSDKRRRNKSSLLDLASDFFSGEESQSSSWLSPSSCSRSCLDQVVSFEVDDARRTSSDGSGKSPPIPTSLAAAIKSELDDASYIDRDDSAASMEQTPVRGLQATDSRQDGNNKGQTTETEMCLICSTEMSLADLRYPMKCLGHSCDYNFCLRCAKEFLKSSKDDYQMASDGSRQVKIHLRCPNCRSDISTQIEEIIHRRTECLESNEDPCTLAPTPLSAIDTSLLGPNFDPDNTIAAEPGVYLNRSGTTRSGNWIVRYACWIVVTLLDQHMTNSHS